jgi:hypothetical protein
MVEYPGAENIALMRTHQELVHFPHNNDDTFVFVSETIEEKLSGLLEAQASEEGMGVSSQESANQRLLVSPPTPRTDAMPSDLSSSRNAAEAMYDRA